MQEENTQDSNQNYYNPKQNYNQTSDKQKDQVAELLKQNLELNKEIYRMTKTVKNYVVWERVFGTIKIFIFIIPLILGFIYLPPLLGNYLQKYSSVLTNISSGLGNFANFGNFKENNVLNSEDSLEDNDQVNELLNKIRPEDIKKFLQ